MTPEQTGTGYDCGAALTELDAFLRGEMPIETAVRMHQHLQHCGGCRDIERYELAFRARLRQLHSATECPPALRARIAEMLAADDADR